MVDAFLTNCRLADGCLVDIGIAGGTIVAVGEGAASLSNSACTRYARRSRFAGLVDGHMHLDKTLTGLPWMGHARDRPA
jgi:cytosine deaminase